MNLPIFCFTRLNIGNFVIKRVITCRVKETKC